MDITCTMAMTRAEFSTASQLPKDLAWMACHFSASGKGLSNLPDALPPGSVVMIDDSFPPNGHDVSLISDQLAPLCQNGIRAVLLDFQRPDLPESGRIAADLTEALPCSVCVTPPYAAQGGPVLLPCPAPHEHLETQLAPWKDRQIWLEATLETERITVTKEDSIATTEAFSPLPDNSFTDDKLLCRYRIQTLEDRIVFTLSRDRQMLRSLLKKAAALGVRHAIGLYQQLGHAL